MKYINTKTIEKSYRYLTSESIKNESILHIFLILKSCNYNNMTSLPLTDISSKGYIPADKLSMLFGPNEEKPLKHEFINPFAMKEWSRSSASEKLKKWVGSRIKNNIIGGATTWRRIIVEDTQNNKIKFSHNYINEIKQLTIPESKIKIWSLVAWYNRFTIFERVMSPAELIKDFIDSFNISDREISSFFDMSIQFNLEYDDKYADFEHIRELINNSDNIVTSWADIKEAEKLEYNTEALKEYTFKIMKTNNINIDKVKEILDSNHQVILTGPPGTSKSYIANEIAKNMVKNGGESLKIQFHPQYTYQDFIGGYVVSGDQVSFNNGSFINFLEKAKTNKHPHILIIDEINRANVSSVLGETIQCLDRGYSITLKLDDKYIEFSIPKNLYIIATMNSTDRTLGHMDFALKRRFAEIYIGANEDDLIENTILECNISARDILSKINRKLKEVLRNNEFVIGQTIFYKQEQLDNGKYSWSDSDFEDLFNYRIMPIIDDYCNREMEKIIEVVGDKLPLKLSESDFIDAMKEYVCK